MSLRRFGIAGLLIGLGLATSACTDGYGYSGVNVGYGGGGYYDPYDTGYGYAGYGAGYGGLSSYYGWSGNYYYPGTGVYVYDRNRGRHRWNDGQRRYWEGRRGNIRNEAIRDNWADFRRDNRGDRRDYRGDLRNNRQAYRDGTINRDQFREGRQQARREFRGDARENLRDTRRETRAVRAANPNPGSRGFRGDGQRGGNGPRGGGRGRQTP